MLVKSRMGGAPERAMKDGAKATLLKAVGGREEVGGVTKGVGE